MFESDAEVAIRDLSVCLDRIWATRLRRDIPTAIVAFANFRAQLQVLNAATLTISEKLAFQDLMSQQLVLDASLQRAQNRHELATQILNDIEKSENMGVKLSSYFYYEMGFSHFNRGDYQLALDCFALVSSQKHMGAIATASEINALFCFDHLGLDIDGPLSQLQVSVQNIEDSVLRGIMQSQLDGYHLHVLFRRGQLISATEAVVAGEFNQASLYRHWLLSLPYHPNYSGLKQLSSAKFAKGQYQALQGYRLRTLLGITHPDDALVCNIFEVADRLYLWTWQWLIEPSRTSFSKLTPLLEILAVNTAQFTSEDRCMVRNALLWIGLINPNISYQLREILHKFATPTPPSMPIFEFEYLLLEYLNNIIAGKNATANDYLVAAYHLIAAQPQQHHLTALLNFFSSSQREDLKSEPQCITTLPTPLSNLGVELTQRINATTKLHVNNGLIIDLFRNSIEFGQGRPAIHSEPLCRAIEILRRCNYVSFSELLGYCFGIKRFDSYIHTKKIYNLLARLKSILPEGLTIRTKQLQVQTVGKWQELTIIGNLIDGRHIDPERFLAQKLLKPQQTARKDFRDKPIGVLLQSKHFTRGDLERTQGVSRSTAHRILAKLIHEGRIRASGDGRATVYHPI